MRRYYLEASQFQADQVHLIGETFHHIFDVCRQDVGSKFEVLGYSDEAWLVEVTQKTKREAFAQKISSRQLPPLPQPHIKLALSLCRYPVMDSVIERSVEMGVHSILPFFSDFSFVRKADSVPVGKKERWSKIVLSATSQSGRGDLMKIEEAQPLEALLQKFANPSGTRAGLFAYEGSGQKNIHEFAQELTPRPQELWIFVGSEGGFSHQEVKVFQDQGLAAVTLGDQVLRVETACIALVSILKYEFGLLRSISGSKKDDDGSF